MAKKYNFDTLVSMITEHDYLSKHGDDCPECQKIKAYGRTLWEQGAYEVDKNGANVEERNEMIRELAKKGYTYEQVAEAIGYSKGYTIKLLRSLDIELPDDGIKTRKGKVILQIKDGNVIEEYPTVAAASRATKVPSNNISRVLQHKQKYAAGFEWKRIKVIQ